MNHINHNSENLIENYKEYNYVKSALMSKKPTTTTKNNKDYLQALTGMSIRIECNST